MMIESNATPTAFPVVVSHAVGRALLAGRQAGSVDLPRLQEAALRAPAGSLLTLDFTGVEVVSASYFAAAIWPLWLMADVAWHPALTNVPPEGVDDIAMVLRGESAAVWLVEVDRNGNLVVEPPKLLGDLESSLHATLRVVLEKGEATAADLMEVDRTVGVTAWSNRLAALFQLRLVRKRKDGRRLIYSATWRR